MNHDIHHPYSKRYCPLLLLLLLCQPLHSTPTTPEMEPTHFLQKAQQHIMHGIPTSYLSWLKIAGSIGLSTLIVYLYLTFRNSPYPPQHQHNYRAPTLLCRTKRTPSYTNTSIATPPKAKKSMDNKSGYAI